MEEIDFPYQISKHFTEVLSRLGAKAPSNQEAAAYFGALNRQCTPIAAEKNILSCETDDPLGSQSYHVTPRLIRQYKNRCLLLTTSKCFAYCRFCFRRSYAGCDDGFITAEELKPVLAWLSEHQEIQEILLSGGDPLTVSADKFFQLLKALRSANPNLLFRVCTRAPVFAPEIFTAAFVEKLKSFKPLWLIPHINHPAEISEVWSPESEACLRLICDSGIPVQSQTVLLRGVNDDVQVLAKLFNELVKIGIKPGYLFQLDLAKGTSHFRVPLTDGMKLYNALKKELSGLSLPVYAMDLPGGGGKINIPAVRFVKDGENWKYTDPNGKNWFYPV